MISSSSSTAEAASLARDPLTAGLLRPPAGGGFEALRHGALPDRDFVLATIERLHQLLVPEAAPASRDIGAEVFAAREAAKLEPLLAEQFRLALEFQCLLDGNQTDACGRVEASRDAARAVMAALPELRQRLFEDARAAWRGDPSCRDPVEALYAFPGVHAVTRYRIANVLHVLGVPLIPRLIAEHAHRMTGIDIHPGATIGREFFIDHGTGVVIGETAEIGDRVTLYQGVTLGAKSFQLDAEGRLVKGLPRHPIVEDDVTIYASATVLGRVRIGRGSVIGGNVWLTHGVPPGSRVYQAEPLETGHVAGSGI